MSRPHVAQQANEAEISVPLVLGNQAPIERLSVACRAGRRDNENYYFFCDSFRGRNWSAAIGGAQRIIRRTPAACAEPAAAERHTGRPPIWRSVFVVPPSEVANGLESTAPLGIEDKAHLASQGKRQPGRPRGLRLVGR
jgi:hypothetical protein